MESGSTSTRDMLTAAKPSIGGLSVVCIGTVADVAGAFVVASVKKKMYFYSTNVQAASQLEHISISYYTEYTICTHIFMLKFVQSTDIACAA